MNVPKLVLVLLCCCGLLVGFVAAQALMNTYTIPQTANIGENLSLDITIDGAAWTNGSIVAWGSIVPNQTFTKTIVFTNTGSVNVSTMTMTVTGLPNGWTETLPAWQTLTPGDSATGVLTLVVPSNATAGSYSWSSDVFVE